MWFAVRNELFRIVESITPGMYYVRVNTLNTFLHGASAKGLESHMWPRSHRLQNPPRDHAVTKKIAISNCGSS